MLLTVGAFVAALVLVAVFMANPAEFFAVGGLVLLTTAFVLAVGVMLLSHRTSA